MSAPAKNMSGLIFLTFYDIQPGKYFSGEGFITEKRYTYDRQPSPRRYECNPVFQIGTHGVCNLVLKLHNPMKNCGTRRLIVGPDLPICTFLLIGCHNFSPGFTNFHRVMKFQHKVTNFVGNNLKHQVTLLPLGAGVVCRMYISQSSSSYCHLVSASTSRGLVLKNKVPSTTTSTRTPPVTQNGRQKPPT